MTRLLERAFAEAQQLPEPEQDALAALVLEWIAAQAEESGRVGKR